MYVRTSQMVGKCSIRLLLPSVTIINKICFYSVLLFILVYMYMFRKSVLTSITSII